MQRPVATMSVLVVVFVWLIVHSLLWSPHEAAMAATTHRHTRSPVALEAAP